MLRIEIVDSPNRSMLARLEASGFTHNEQLDFLGHTSQDFGLNVEVWTKQDGKSAVTMLDISDLEDTEVL